eukprot:NODE_236_length_3330_cov_5.990009.p1 GENE.NODE_236_length_3330_cov_5.990009~~NODE_236_length_3330_cov_5.990009.p1  ORF type:complete len:720 (-),score=130.07 NODE_236_length_3330_cov_5.990009:566-2725(-)
MDREPKPEMLRVPLDEVVLAVCNLGLDRGREDWSSPAANADNPNSYTNSDSLWRAASGCGDAGDASFSSAAAIDDGADWNVSQDDADVDAATSSQWKVNAYASGTVNSELQVDDSVDGPHWRESWVDAGFDGSSNSQGWVSGVTEVAGIAGVDACAHDACTDDSHWKKSWADVSFDEAAKGHRRGPCTGVWNFLEGSLDAPSWWSVKVAVEELQYAGALDDYGYITFLGALLVRLPLAPSLGAAYFLAGLLGAPWSASLVAAAVQSREPWARHGRDGENEGAAAIFTKGLCGEEIWSDAFTAARVLREYRESRSGISFCAGHRLIHNAMQQMSSAQVQLFRLLRDCGCVNGNTGSTACAAPPAETAETAEAAEAPKAASSLEAADDLETSWPVMQLMLLCAQRRNLGKWDGGRRVDAGWTKPARLSRFSVLCSDGTGCEPPSDLLTYSEFSSGCGRLLRIASMVTPQQMLLFGGRRAPSWLYGRAVLEDWLHIPCEFESAALLVALRGVTRRALEHAAQTCIEARDAGSRASHGEDRWLACWRACMLAVAKAVTPPAQAPVAQHTTAFGAVVPGQATYAASSAAGADSGAEPQPGELPIGAEPQPGELPIGWSMHVDEEGREYFCCIYTGETRWERPSLAGAAAAGLWSCALHGGQRYYFRRTDQSSRQWERPEVGDALVLPFGWEAFWDATRQRHFYSHAQATTTTWEFPSAPVCLAS